MEPYNLVAILFFYGSQMGLERFSSVTRGAMLRRVFRTRPARIQSFSALPPQQSVCAFRGLFHFNVPVLANKDLIDTLTAPSTHTQSHERHHV
jgi:hypothetical protein